MKFPRSIPEGDMEICRKEWELVGYYTDLFGVSSTYLAVNEGTWENAFTHTIYQLYPDQGEWKELKEWRNFQIGSDTSEDK